jgi:tRNA(Ile)-lysidine synthase
MTGAAAGRSLDPPKLAAGATVWLAYSGGLDSTVLLHQLHAAGLRFRAIHVNHHLQPASDSWAELCRSAAGQLGVPLYVIDVEVDPKDPAGPEAAARTARHAAFASVMKPGDCLVTAHHRDDQAETVLLRLVRGAGVAGLAAMRPVSALPPFVVWRPLLGLPRADLRQYADRHHLRWIEDPHNRDPRYSRSFLRNEILSRLSQRWPGASEALARTAEHCADAVELLDEMAASDLPGVAAGLSASPRKRGDAWGDGVSVRQLLSLSPARRRNVLRAWIARSGQEAPSAGTLQRVEGEVLRARPDAAPVLGWGGVELRRFRDALQLMPRLPPAPRDVTLEWDGRRHLELPPGCGTLYVLKPATAELPLRVAFVRGGERLKPAGARFTRTLRNLFQEEAIPPWIRERMPLIRLADELQAVADRWQAAPFRSLCRRSGLRFEWRHALPGDPMRQ